MKKDVFRIVILIFAILLIILSTVYIIDRYRMNNNKPVLFSTWGYDYAPPEKLYLNENNTNNSNNEEQYFYGRVIESTLEYIIVEPNEGENIRKTADKISIDLEKDNDSLYMKDSNIKVTHSGYIMETYPAKVNAIKIELVSKIELMYEKVIDDIISQDEGLNNNAKYISLDVDGFVLPKERGQGNVQNKYLGLEENQKQTLLRYCKKYNSDIKKYSMEELKENGLFNKEEVRIYGILIYLENVEKITENSAIMTFGKYRSGLGAIFPKYKLTYKNNVWNIELLQMAIS